MNAAVEQLFVLWKLRVEQARGGWGSGVGRVASLAGLVVLGALAVLAFVGIRRVFVHPAIVADGLLSLFLVLLVPFLAGTLLATWPVVTATVDDSAELSRFALFPVTPSRLFLSSVAAGMVEPRTWPVWGAVAGTIGGWTQGYGLGVPGLLLGLAGAVLLVACATVWGRVGLHALLLVLRRRRSAEAMGAGLFLLLALTAFVPPPDLGWLRTVATGVGEIDVRLLRGSLVLFTALPTGGFGWMLAGAAMGRPLATLAGFAWLSAATFAGYFLALHLLGRFHAHAGRALPQEGLTAPRDTRRFLGDSLLGVLVEREVRDLLLNPRVRVMVAVPFLLVILLRLIDAPGLLAIAAGPSGGTWVLVGVTSYASLVLAAGLSQNAFGFDGGGILALLQSPVDVSRVLLAKNVAHAGLSLVLAAVLALFAVLLLGTREPAALAVTALNASFQAGLFVGGGNVLSVTFPQRFHASLKRRDRPPAPVVAVGFALAALAVMPVGSFLRALDRPPGAADVIQLLPLPVAGLLAWGLGTRVALRLLSRRRERLTRQVLRR